MQPNLLKGCFLPACWWRLTSRENSSLQILRFSLNPFTSDWEKRNISTTEYFRWNSGLREKNQQNKISHKPHISHFNVGAWTYKWQPFLVPLHPPGAAGGPRAASPAALHQGWHLAELAQAQPNPAAVDRPSTSTDLRAKVQRTSEAWQMSVGFMALVLPIHLHPRHLFSWRLMAWWIRLLFQMHSKIG